MQAAILEDTHEAWLEDAVATIIGISHTLPDFSADQLAREMRKPPHANLVGTAFRMAKRAGHIEWVCYVRSTNKTRKGGSVSIWRRVQEGIGS